MVWDKRSVVYLNRVTKCFSLAHFRPIESVDVSGVLSPKWEDLVFLLLLLLLPLPLEALFVRTALSSREPDDFFGVSGGDIFNAP